MESEVIVKVVCHEQQDACHWKLIMTADFLCYISDKSE